MCRCASQSRLTPVILADRPESDAYCASHSPRHSAAQSALTERLPNRCRGRSRGERVQQSRRNTSNLLNSQIKRHPVALRWHPKTADLPNKLQRRLPNLILRSRRPITNPQTPNTPTHHQIPLRPSHIQMPPNMANDPNLVSTFQMEPVVGAGRRPESIPSSFPADNL